MYSICLEIYEMFKHFVTEMFFICVLILFLIHLALKKVSLLAVRPFWILQPVKKKSIEIEKKSPDYKSHRTASFFTQYPNLFFQRTK